MNLPQIIHNKRGRKPKHLIQQHQPQINVPLITPQINQNMQVQQRYQNGQINGGQSYSENTTNNLKINQNQVPPPVLNTKPPPQKDLTSNISDLTKKTTEMINMTKVLSSLMTQLNPKIQDMISYFNDTSNVIIRNLENKMQKMGNNNPMMQEYQQQQQELNEFTQENTRNIEQFIVILQAQIGQIRPVVDFQFQKIQIKQSLEIQHQELPVENNQYRYDKVVQKLGENIFAMKLWQDEQTNIVEVTKNDEGQYEAYIQYQIDCVPQFIVQQENRLIVDDQCFNIQLNNLVQQFDEEYVQGIAINDKLLFLAASTYYKYSLLCWNGSKYDVRLKGSIFSKQGMYKDKSIQLIFKNPFQQDQIHQELHIFVTSAKRELFKYKLNLARVENSSRNKLFDRTKNVTFINQSLLLSEHEGELALINYDIEQTLIVYNFQQQLPVNVYDNQFHLNALQNQNQVFIPRQFDPKNFGLLVAVNFQQRKVLCLDILNQGISCDYESGGLDVGPYCQIIGRNYKKHVIKPKQFKSKPSRDIFNDDLEGMERDMIGQNEEDSTTKNALTDMDNTLGGISSINDGYNNKINGDDQDPNVRDSDIIILDDDGQLRVFKFTIE